MGTEHHAKDPMKSIKNLCEKNHEKRLININRPNSENVAKFRNK